MDNPIKLFKVRCAAIGTNINQLSKRTGIKRSVFDRWEDEEPKSLKLLKRMESELSEMEAEYKKKKHVKKM